MRIRSFIALEFPTNIQLEIAKKISNLVQRYPKPMVRWVDPKIVHLTLSFLGDQTTSDLRNLADRMRNELQFSQPIILRINKPGFFPNNNKPRVLWVDIEHQPTLHKLQEEIEAICSRIGILKEEKRFSPHLTLGRIRNYREIPDLKKFLNDFSTISFENIDPVNIRDVKIFKSELKQTGPVYNILYSITFIT